MPPGRFQGEAKARNKVEKRSDGLAEPGRLDGGKQGEGVKDMKEETKASLCSPTELNSTTHWTDPVWTCAELPERVHHISSPRLVAVGIPSSLYYSCDGRFYLNSPFFFSPSPLILHSLAPAAAPLPRALAFDCFFLCLGFAVPSCYLQPSAAICCLLLVPRITVLTLVSFAHRSLRERERQTNNKDKGDKENWPAVF